MAKTDRVKGIKVEIGGDVKGLNQALSSTNKEISNTQSQLKDVERLLKLDPTNTQLLEQKQRLLGEAVEGTRDKLETLKVAEKQVQEEFEKGKVSQQQYEALQREIIDTEMQLGDLESRAKEANAAVNKIDEDPVKDVEAAADDAGEALRDAAGEANTFGDVLSAGAVIEGVKALGGAISDLSAETAEYRKIMGSLEISSEAAGYTAEETAATYKQLFGVLGDDQTAATTTANLQALKLSQEDLVKITNSAIGAWAKYGDSIPIDGLAESINETIRSGTVTGTFADVLNWGAREGETFGVMLKENTEANAEWNQAVMDAVTAEDYFNLALQDAGTQAERVDLLMRAMADQGLQKAGEAWQQNNEDIVKANEAQADFTAKAAELSETVAPAIQAVKDGGADLFGVFADAAQKIDFDALGEKIGAVFEAVEGIVSFLIDNGDLLIAVLGSIAAGLVALKLAELGGLLISVATGVTTLSAAFPLLGSAIAILTNPIFIVTAAIVALVALIATKGDEIQAIIQKVDDFLQNVFLIDWTQIFGPGLGDVLNAFMANLKNIWDAVKQIFDGVIDFIRGVFTGDWERAWSGVVSIFGGLFNGLVALVKAPINGIIGLLNAAVGAINTLIGGLNRISFQLPSWMGGGSFGINIPTIPNIPYLAKGGVLSSGSAIVGEAGPELLTMNSGRAVVQPLAGNNSATASAKGAAAAPEQPTPIFLSLSLDGKIIGQAAWNYSRGRERANG